MARPVAPRALYQDVAERLRQLIYRGELAPGAWIDERALVVRFGISRTPLREALKVLHAEGLIRLTPRRGAFVAAEPTPRDLDEIFPLLSLLEGLCAREAVEKATRDDVRRVEALHARLERHAAAGEEDRYDAQDDALHELLQEIAANPWLSRAASELRRLLRLVRGRRLRVPGRVEASLAAHRTFLRALRRRDPAEAERVMRDHLMSGRAALPAPDAGATRGTEGSSRREAPSRRRARPRAAPRARAPRPRRG